MTTENAQPIITVRPSHAVVNRFNVWMERGESRAYIKLGLQKEVALRFARNKAYLLKTEFKDLTHLTDTKEP